ncbi:MAG: HAMP domain-containing sensor histidine kinase [Bacteroidaceae bacterium]|jgi:signal transduction histidine kinase|nr:HAMP domain-containing sensor histidine kinase [Bacteroidaceae bacterium]
MQWIDKNKQIKYVLILAAVVIATISLVFSHYLVCDLERDAQSKMSVWAEAMRSLNNADENTDLSLVLKVINNNNTIPVIVLNKKGHVTEYRNIKLKFQDKIDSVHVLYEKVEEMRENGYSIRMSYSQKDDSAKGDYLEILYDDSVLLKRLSIYPYVQLGVAGVFIMIMIFALLSLKRAEQNRVWVGLTKETAHQLGTPISSLMAWIEIMKENYPEDPMIGEMGKDIDRLNLIAERFSKVGSKPEATEENLNEILWHVVNYISLRSSDKVLMVCNFPATPVIMKICAPLFEWVIENLCKNAIDAMCGRGRIVITMHEITTMVIIEVSDTGKGIPKNRFKSVFAPGYTTKQRGWGLGLSLARRIVEKYHNGRIFVKNSEIGKGTVFRIELRK